MSEAFSPGNLSLILTNSKEQSVTYVTNTVHAVSPFEIVMAAVGFIILAYWLVKVTKNKEFYEKWINPNGNQVNLYKIIRILFYAYVAVVILAGVAQILIMRHTLG